MNVKEGPVLMRPCIGTYRDPAEREAGRLQYDQTRRERRSKIRMADEAWLYLQWAMACATVAFPDARGQVLAMVDQITDPLGPLVAVAHEGPKTPIDEQEAATDWLYEKSLEMAR